MRSAARYRLVVVAMMGMLVGGGLLRTGEAPEVVPSRPPEPPVLPPTLPMAPTPIDRFRALLELSPAQREQQLALRKPAQREYLGARLAEFDPLSPRDRELRLQLLTLRHHLLPFLRTAPTNRAEGLRLVPIEYRGLVRDRLMAWDQLSAEQQRAMLESESVFAGLALISRPGGLDAGERALSQLSPEPRRRIEADLERWQALSPEERQKITQRFQSFLTLSPREQQKTLARLDDARRERAARLVESLEQLPPDRHVKSVEALRRFSALPSHERERFLRNAARWQTMSAEQKSAWRHLLAELPPPPPGFGRVTSPGPPVGRPLPPPWFPAENEPPAR